jgi:uncharacterized protein YjbJ (UPF0337 family)
MNQRISNGWSELEAMIMQDLTGVTDRDLAACGGNRDKLVEKLQEIYDISSNEAEGAVAYYEYQLALRDDNHRTRTIV